MDQRTRDRIAQLLGTAPAHVAPLSGGCIGEVYRLQTTSGRRWVAKVADPAAGSLECEAWMLRYLAEHSRLPVPAVLHGSTGLLLMEFLPGQSRFSAQAQRHAAELLSALHDIEGETFGLEQDTLIGGLHQPNPPTASWIDFFRQHRLLHRAEDTHRAGQLPTAMLRRLERLADRLEEWLDASARPSLIHGDVWSTNVLAERDRVTGFVDPAIYYADAEMELAFITLFNTFGEPFFERYGELRPIRSGFFEERRDLYTNLYPLLVHVRLFGGGYLGGVDRILRRFGF